jgi:hypothetical protein
MQVTCYEERLIKDQKYQSITEEYCKFIDCSFENCSFEDCTINHCHFVNCSFYNCNIISLTSQYSEIKNTVFKKCNLIGIHGWNGLLPVGKYTYAIERIEDCCLKYNSFIEMNFRKFDFSGNVIQESIFEECDLQESNFRNCRLEATQFFRCDVRKADFREAKGYVIDIPSNKLRQAKFSFPEVVSLLDSLEIKIE